MMMPLQLLPDASAKLIVTAAVALLFTAAGPSDAAASAFEIKVVTSGGSAGLGWGGRSSSGAGPFVGGGGIPSSPAGIVSDSRTAVSARSIDDLVRDVVALDLGNGDSLIVSGDSVQPMARSLSGVKPKDTTSAGNVANPVSPVLTPLLAALVPEVAAPLIASLSGPVVASSESVELVHAPEPGSLLLLGSGLLLIARRINDRRRKNKADAV